MFCMPGVQDRPVTESLVYHDMSIPESYTV